MPIPTPDSVDSNGSPMWSSKEKLFETYAQEPYNWFRTITFEWVDFNARLGACIATKYFVDGAKLPCKCDGKNEYTLLNLRGTGVNITCAYCRITTGQLDEKAMEILGQRRVSFDEALKIMKETGQKQPPSFPTTKTRFDHMKALK